MEPMDPRDQDVAWIAYGSEVDNRDVRVLIPHETEDGTRWFEIQYVPADDGDGDGEFDVVDVARGLPEEADEPEPAADGYRPVGADVVLDVLERVSEIAHEAANRGMRAQRLADAASGERRRLRAALDGIVAGLAAGGDGSVPVMRRVMGGAGGGRRWESVLAPADVVAWGRDASGTVAWTGFQVEYDSEGAVESVMRRDARGARESDLVSIGYERVPFGVLWGCVVDAVDAGARCGRAVEELRGEVAALRDVDSGLVGRTLSGLCWGRQYTECGSVFRELFWPSGGWRCAVGVASCVELWWERLVLRWDVVVCEWVFVRWVQDVRWSVDGSRAAGAREVSLDEFVGFAGCALRSVN